MLYDDGSRSGSLLHPAQKLGESDSQNSKRNKTRAYSIMHSLKISISHGFQIDHCKCPGGPVKVLEVSINRGNVESERKSMGNRRMFDPELVLKSFKVRKRCMSWGEMSPRGELESVEFKDVKVSVRNRFASIGTSAHASKPTHVSHEPGGQTLSTRADLRAVSMRLGMIWRRSDVCRNQRIKRRSTSRTTLRCRDIYLNASPGDLFETSRN